jgi:hypothetical protein
MVVWFKGTQLHLSLFTEKPLVKSFQSSAGGIANKHVDYVPVEQRRYHGLDYVKFEEYPKDGRVALGRFWTKPQLDKINAGCGNTTRMEQSIAETYARQPGYYGGTFCVHCRNHFPVGADGEFVWLDNPDQRVGT